MKEYETVQAGAKVRIEKLAAHPAPPKIFCQYHINIYYTNALGFTTSYDYGFTATAVFSKPPGFSNYI